MEDDLIFEPGIKEISDIYYRLIANIPVSVSYDLRRQFQQEWKVLEERLKDFKNQAREDEARLEGLEQGRKEEGELLFFKKKTCEQECEWECFKEFDHGWNCGNEDGRKETRLECLKEIEKKAVNGFDDFSDCLCIKRNDFRELKKKAK